MTRLTRAMIIAELMGAHSAPLFRGAKAIQIREPSLPPHLKRREERLEAAEDKRTRRAARNLRLARPSELLGIPIQVDPGVPERTVRVEQGGKEVGRGRIDPTHLCSYCGEGEPGEDGLCGQCRYELSAGIT